MTTFKIEWRNNSKGLMIWTFVFNVVIILFGALFPEVYRSYTSSLIDQMMENLPVEFLKAFNLDGEGLTSFTTTTGFFAYYFQYLFVAACIYAVLSGTNALIKEESDGTLYFIYAQPISRMRIYVEKVVANALKLTVFWFISAGCSIAVFLFFKQDQSNSVIIQQISKIYAYEWLVLIWFLSLGFLLSTWIHSSKQSAGISMGVVFGLYLLGVLSSLKDSFQWIENFSPIRLATPSLVMENGIPMVWLWIVVGIIFFFVGGFMYRKKDFRLEG